MAQQKKDMHLPKAVTNFRIRGIAVYPRLDTPDTKFNTMGVYKTGVRTEGQAAVEVKTRIVGLINETFEAHKNYLLENGGARLAKDVKAAAKAAAKSKGKKSDEALERLDDDTVLLVKDGAPQKAGDGSFKTLSYSDRAFKEELDEEGNETGAVIFNAKTTASYKDKTGKVVSRKVPIIDAKLKPVTKAVWGGSLINVNVDLVPFATAIGVGVSIRLNGVQVIELRSGGRDAKSMFDEEDGYESEDTTSVTDGTSSAGGHSPYDDDDDDDL